VAYRATPAGPPRPVNGLFAGFVGEILVAGGCRPPPHRRSLLLSLRRVRGGMVKIVVGLTLAAFAPACAWSTMEVLPSNQERTSSHLHCTAHRRSQLADVMLAGLDLALATGSFYAATNHELTNSNSDRALFLSAGGVLAGLALGHVFSSIWAEGHLRRCRDRRAPRSGGL